MSATPQDRFFYYMKNLLQQLSNMFPDCPIISTLSSQADNLDAATIITPWLHFMRRPEIAAAVASEDLEPFRNAAAKSPIDTVLNLDEKLASPLMTPETRTALWEFIRILNQHASDYVSQQSRTTSGAPNCATSGAPSISSICTQSCEQTGGEYVCAARPDSGWKASDAFCCQEPAVTGPPQLLETIQNMFSAPDTLETFRSMVAEGTYACAAQPNSGFPPLETFQNIFEAASQFQARPGQADLMLNMPVGPLLEAFSQLQDSGMLEPMLAQIGISPMLLKSLGRITTAMRHMPQDLTLGMLMENRGASELMNTIPEKDLEELAASLPNAEELCAILGTMCPALGGNTLTQLMKNLQPESK